VRWNPSTKTSRDHRHLPEPDFLCEAELRYQAIEGELLDLDQEGFFGRESARHTVIINVVAPVEENEVQMRERAARLNPPESLSKFRRDIGLAGQR